MGFTKSTQAIKSIDQIDDHIYLNNSYDPGEKYKYLKIVIYTQKGGICKKESANQKNSNSYSNIKISNFIAKNWQGLEMMVPTPREKA